MSVSIAYNFGMTTKEALTTGVVGASNPTVSFESYNRTGNLNGTTTPSVTKQVQFLLTLVAGAYTINLASLIGANGTVDATGLKLQMIRIKNLGANNMTFATGASNGYAVQTSFSKILYPLGIWQEIFNGGTPVIAAGARTIDVTGTGTQQAEVSLAFG